MKAPIRPLETWTRSERRSHRRNVGPVARSAALTLLGLAWATPASAEPVAGVCPDGSFFVVARREAAPCERPKFVPASELPPLRPQYLPRPYTWYLDQEARDENNPYNLVDKAQQIRALRSGEVEAGAVPDGAARTQPAQTEVARTPPGLTASSAPATPAIAFGADEISDLAQLITLRQSLAPAALRVDDVRGALALQLKLAYSPAFEARVLESLGRSDTGEHVIAFSVRSEQPTEFWPRFFVTQAGASFRPEAERRAELGFVLGEPGSMEAGLVSLGYLVLPPRFDPAQPLTVWWNDRRIDATLHPESEGAVEPELSGRSS